MEKDPNGGGNVNSERSPLSVETYPELDLACSAYDQGDFLKAYALYLPVAQEGNPVAQTMIGSMNEWGLGVSTNQIEAAQWYQLAANQDYEEGILFSAQLMDKLGRYKEAATNYEKAANLGSLVAAFRLGAFCNRYGTDKLYWLQKAADSGHIYAMVLLGRRMMWRHVPGGFVRGVILIFSAIWQLSSLVSREEASTIRDHPRLSK